MMKAHPHDNVVRYHDSHLVGDELWVIMELMDGGALTSIVQKSRSALVRWSSVVTAVATFTLSCTHLQTPACTYMLSKLSLLTASQRNKLPPF